MPKLFERTSNHQQSVFAGLTTEQRRQLIEGNFEPKFPNFTYSKCKCRDKNCRRFVIDQSGAEGMFYGPEAHLLTVGANYHVRLLKACENILDARDDLELAQAFILARVIVTEARSAS